MHPPLQQCSLQGTRVRGIKQSVRSHCADIKLHQGNGQGDVSEGYKHTKQKTTILLANP